MGVERVRDRLLQFRRILRKRFFEAEFTQWRKNHGRDIEFEPIPALAVDLSAIEERLGRPLHGVLGYSFLGSRAVRIDYPARRVDIYDAALDAGASPGAVVLPLELEGTDVIIDDFRVNGQPVRVSLDTGSSLTLEIYDHAADRLGLAALRDGAEEGTVVGARGEASILTVTVDSIGIGDLVIDSPSVVFPETSRAVDGNLGNGYLRHYVLTVDYLGKRLVLEPGSG